MNLPIASLDTDRELDRATWLGRGVAEASTLRICETVRLNSVNLPIGSLDTDRELDRETWLGRGVAEASTLRICETVSTLNKRVARGGLAVQ